MAEKYYRGEDIVITLSMYKDESLKDKLDLSTKNIDLLIYSYSNNKSLIASTDIPDGTGKVLINRVDDFTLIATFPAEMTLLLGTGGARVEIKIQNKEDGSVIITTTDSITIENSFIATLT